MARQWTGGTGPKTTYKDLPDTWVYFIVIGAVVLSGAGYINSERSIESVIWTTVVVLGFVGFLSGDWIEAEWSKRLVERASQEDGTAD